MSTYNKADFIGVFEHIEHTSPWWSFTGQNI